MNMIEKVARALCWKSTLSSTVMDEPSAADLLWIDHNWPRHAETARAAIEAMLEPTEAMVSRTYDSDILGSPQPGNPDPEVTWRAMIDTALKADGGES